MTTASEAAERLIVIGAGTMGRGVAEVSARAGYEVPLCDLDAGALERALEHIRGSLTQAVERGKATAEQRTEALARITTSTDLAAELPEAAIVIEAVPEHLELKKKIFTQLGELCPPTALLATNTSSLPITEITSAASHPGRSLGMHFFNPVPKMKLLEIVRGSQTSEAAIDRALEVARRLGKEPIVVRDAPGFASSRLGIAFAMEAIRMVEQEVASPEAIDTAMTLGYRHPM
ncbi:MAG: 3-hydroxyacyl-CoA dehydrogenase family protein, partial [Planctomycetota bacterium]